MTGRLPILRVLAAALFTCICATALTPARAQTAFYIAAPGEIAGPPGSVIRAEQMFGAPGGAASWRVLYRSTGLGGEPIAVSGVVIVPPGPTPAGGWPVIAWAHPTTGVVPRCAPSLSPFLFPLIPGLRDMIGRGYVVAATDYPGLGTPGPHPYLVGDSEGRAVLDSVRAARDVPGVGASNRYAVWGHSQGGQAVLYAGILAQRYAPELNLVGVAAAAPATELGTLFKDDLASPAGKNLTSMTLWSWSRVFGAPIDSVVDPAAIPRVDMLAQECIGSIPDFFERHMADAFLAREFLDVSDLTEIQPWRGIMEANTPGALPARIPVFLSQGTADRVVEPNVTYAYRDELCRAGVRVQLVELPGVGHGFAGYRSARAAIEWIADRFADSPAPSDCGN
ncbi:MAG: lipase [Xanthobacteraceae bacterium]|jgi:acetyl esterase/lipase|nr:lipase [Xanthobacteraceae bacterium]